MTVAEKIADYLASKGCTHAFGIVGGANLTLFSEIAKRLTVVSVCHEQAAAIAGAYFYRVSGRIAPCLVKRGPNDRSMGFQGFNPVDVAHSFTKQVVSVDNPLAAIHSLDSLYNCALENRQGPCWLDIPQDITAMPV